MESLKPEPRNPGSMTAWAEWMDTSLGLRLILEKSRAGSGEEKGKRSREERLLGEAGGRDVSMREDEEEAKETPERRVRERMRVTIVFFILASLLSLMPIYIAINRPINNKLLIYKIII
jgi:hypothetical protein